MAGVSTGAASLAGAGAALVPKALREVVTPALASLPLPFHASHGVHALGP